jgi:hypothetical protein
MKEYMVNLWACKPWTDDLCCCGVETESKEEAMAIYLNPEGSGRFKKYFSIIHDPEVWIEIVGPDLDECRMLYKRASTPDTDDDWKREMAIQAGMGLGIEAYNDEMGW